MSAQTVEAAVAFMADTAAKTRQSKIKLTFHGGEPLVAGPGILRRALDGLATRVGCKGFDAAIQSNLWLLDEEFCTLFRKHRVEIGTSLDGPEDITDRQRGPGYFARTMAGIRKARDHGLQAGCIATFTPSTLPRWREVFDFFLAERLGFSIHPAVLPLNGNTGEGSCPPSDSQTRNPRYHLAPGEYGTLLCRMLDYYVDHRRELAISSLDQMTKGLVCGEGKVCTFRDCLGMFLSIDPNGDIYPCQRFCGLPEYRMGTLANDPTLTDLFSSPIARRLAARQEHVHQHCKECSHLSYCKGGCPYNVWASNQVDRVQDPYCEAYRTVFNHIQNRLSAEMATKENINAMAERPWTGQGHPLLRKGPLIELVRDGPHPSQTARTAKRIIAAVELAKGPDIPAVAVRLVKMGICRNQESAVASLTALDRQLHPEVIPLNNLYLHITFRCQLECTHCYARADAHGHEQGEMSVAALEKLIREAKEAQFRQVVITGGEPLIHSERQSLLRMLVRLHLWTAPMNLVLRTNLAMDMDDDTLCLIAQAVDQVVVSVDGNEQTHDTRRGRGAYAAVVRNLEFYTEISKKIPKAGELSLATVMRAVDIQSEAGHAVRELARRLGVRRTRFRPLLPLGRAADWDEPPASEPLGAHIDPMELIENGFHPVACCGFGQNLYVEPSGQSFPCYAYHRPHAFLGNVIENGLSVVLHSEGFQDLARHTVNTNPKCSDCEVRYLCGGACRAWGVTPCQHDLDKPPFECNGLKKRATGLLVAARHYLAQNYKEKTDVQKI